MNSLYHKVAVVSVCTALSFTLGATQEAKAAIFFLPGIQFRVEGNSYIDAGEKVLDSSDSLNFLFVEKLGNYRGPFSSLETRGFYEYNLGNLSLPPNTIIKRAFLDLGVERLSVKQYYEYLYVDIFGYVGNGKPDVSDFEAGVALDRKNISYNPSLFGQFYTTTSDVTQFVNARISNGDNFAGFGIRIENSYANYGKANLTASLYIEAEPVPEPTTIFGSALALSVGGWLKRKKLSQQNKTTAH
jgi:hypothetical protein